jgi:hypothetical protein
MSAHRTGMAAVLAHRNPRGLVQALFIDSERTTERFFEDSC